MIVQFAVSTYKSPSLPISAQRVVNCYAEMQPPNTKTQVAVFGCPGVVQWATLGAGPIRGFDVMGGVLYVVSGGTLYSVSSTGIGTALGGTISGTGPVVMDNNGSQIAIVNGVSGYIYSAGTGFTLISDADFNAANTVTFFDQRFLFDWAGTNKFFCSQILDGTDFDALQFASAETRPDNVLAVKLNKQILLVFGDKSIEAWQDVGAANFPFQAVPGAVIERGLAAAHAVAKEDNSVFFLGDDRTMYRLDGLSPSRITTHAIEAEWRGYSVVSDAFAFSYTWNGHKFIVVTFPTANTTWEYDIATQLWHERESWDINGRSLGRWRFNCQVSVYDKILVGDAFSGAIGYLSASTYDELGTTVQMKAVSPPIHKDRKRVFIPRFEMDIEAGVGITTGQGSDPQVMLRISRDGGRTYGVLQKWRSMGALGQYKTRMRWLKNGQAREWAFEATISDPVKRTIIAANADIYGS